MSNLKNCFRKIEDTMGRDNSLSFSNYFGEFLQLISGRSRCLPSERKEHDPEFEEASARLLKKYLSQKEPGLTKFKEEYIKAFERLGVGPRSQE